ncbi:MAG: HEAT repeat domain-containing protein [Candidatus Sulfotelmatobacter sp.]|jgi:HEAT repeat protein
MPRTLKKMLTIPAAGRAILLLILLTAACCAQTVAKPGWSVLEAGLAQKSAGQRLAAVRVLGLISDDPHAAELAETALKDKNSSVRTAAATSLGQMHASGANPSLKEALNDKSLSVVMAAAHALRLLNDAACYDVYYEVYTGERKNNSGMIVQEMQIIHNPRQLALMGFNEGIGYVPFADIPWGALQTIMKDKKSGTAAKAALISALATDPESRTGKLLLTTSQNRNRVLRVAALEAISKRGDFALAPGLEPRLSDSRREVRLAAAATLIHLGDLATAQSTAEEKIAQALLPVNAREAQSTTATTETTK